MSTGVSGENIDFTVMMWFKIDKEFYTGAKAPEGEQGGVPPQIMYLFQFEDSVACFFTDTLTLMCDSWDRRKLQIKSTNVTPGIWYHLTLSSSSKGESFLLIQDSSHQVVAEDTIRRFGFRQNKLYVWRACLGDCAADFGFFGGIREVVLIQRALSKQEALLGKNIIMTYNSDIKAYFRFQDIHNKFEKDEFVDWPLLAFKNKPARKEDYIGKDIIPNDVCPSLFKQISALRFNEDNKLEDFQMDVNLDQNQYSYTMSMTIMVNETSCVAVTPDKAELDCNLVKLEGVFMLWLRGQNTARFYFFSSKNYYESVSENFFIPYDQWITIQLTLEQYNGYTVVVADQNGNAFYRTKVQQNMQQQWPTRNLELFRAFDGYVENFYLTNTLKPLNPYFAIDFRNEDGLINMWFTKDEFSSGFYNRGSLGQKFDLSGTQTFEDIFFEIPAEGGRVTGTLDDPIQVFDGIACNDRHITCRLNTAESYISFATPALTDWSQQNSIEFWFKIEDPAVYDQDVLLFSMVSGKVNAQLYYHVYIENGDLKCAPFGTQSFKDPILSFTQFSLENQDSYGWWHISCSYKFQDRAKGILFNTNVEQSLEQTMIGQPKFYPTNSLLASFGKSMADNVLTPAASGVLVKEFRFWNKQLTALELLNNRYRQVDPTKLPAEMLLVYMRMATGSSLIENFATRQPDYVHDYFNAELNGISYIADFIETEQYSYDVALDLVVAQTMRTYHTVCPVHTYFMNQYCYNEPVNKAVLAIFPLWNDISNQLSWEMTLIHSSVINRDVIQFLTDSWSSNDAILNDFFEQTESTLDYIIPSNILRHEAEYEIKAELTNDELTFLNTADVKFSPSKCKWFTVVDHGVSQGYTVLEISPGNEDITFQIELKRHPDIDCSEFDFFNAFAGLDFEFIMTDTNDYISYVPKMEVRAYDPFKVSDNEVAIGQVVPQNMVIDVTLTAKEQEKLPVFQDILIMVSAHWSSSESANPQLTSDIIFQNLLYTIKFEPTANVLFADFVANKQNIIREETLILDASSSYISNMPVNQQKRLLGFSWQCPEFLKAFCRTQAGSQLFVPYSQVEQGDASYGIAYEFSVKVIWAKPDGNEEAETGPIEVTWFNLVQPEFNIDFDKSHTLITSNQNALFYMQAINFDAATIADYDVVWSITPDLADPDNLTILSGGRVMQINKGSFAKNTIYVLTLTLTHKQLGLVTNAKTVSIATQAPPEAGNIQVTPFEGYIGDEFTVSLTGWTSANLPIEYNVYSTLDNDGKRMGTIMNEDGPIPVDEVYKFIAKKTTPIIVSIFDQSGETIEVPLSPSITQAPIIPDEPDTVPDGGDEIIEPADEDTAADADADADAQADADTDATDADSTADADTAVDADADADAAADAGRRAMLLAQIQGTQNLSMRVNFMSIAIETVKAHDAETSDKLISTEEMQEQTDFRRQLLAEIELQIIEFKDKKDSGVVDPLLITAQDLIVEQFLMLSQLTNSPHYLDQDIVDKVQEVVERLMTMNGNLFDLLLEADSDNTLRSSFFNTLGNLNRYARINLNEATLLWVRELLESTMDKMCAFVDLPEVFAYASSSGTSEIGFSLLKFDQQSALKSRRGTLRALDASYDYNAFTMYNQWFSTSEPGQLCLQVYGQQFGTVSMNGAYLGNSKARLQASVYEQGSGSRFTMGELSGQTIATFDLDRDSFKNNQTVCMGKSLKNDRWGSASCLSELFVQKVQMKCTCNAVDSNQIGIFSDYTRTLAEAVDFPAIEVYAGLDQLAVIDTTLDSEVTKEVNDEVKLNGTNYVWMGQSLLSAILCLAGSLLTIKMDRKDESRTKAAISSVSALRETRQNQFVMEIAKELNEPYGQVCQRKQQLFYYRTIYSKSSFPHLMSQMHPLLSPFTSFYATAGRFMRFTMYMLQVNIVTALVYVFYSAGYRQEQTRLDNDVIDTTDMHSLILVTCLCSLLLTPMLSEPLIKACSNKLVTSSAMSAELEESVSVETQRKGLRMSLIVASIVLSVALPVWAIAASSTVPASIQYCMATTVMISLFLATLGTNLVYLMINACLARKVAYAPNKNSSRTSKCMVHYRALQIVRDMKAVCEIKDQFTLADVLPSSLEVSDREIQASCSGVNNINLSAHLEAKMPNGDLVFHDKVIKESQETVKVSTEGAEEDKQVFTDNNGQNPDDSSRRSLTKHNRTGSHADSSVMPNNNDIASMIGRSMIDADLDRSRNDVVPQRTVMDDGNDEEEEEESDSVYSQSHQNQPAPLGAKVILQ